MLYKGKATLKPSFGTLRQLKLNRGLADSNSGVKEDSERDRLRNTKVGCDNAVTNKSKFKRSEYYRIRYCRVCCFHRCCCDGDLCVSISASYPRDDCRGICQRIIIITHFFVKEDYYV